MIKLFSLKDIIVNVIRFKEKENVVMFHLSNVIDVPNGENLEGLIYNSNKGKCRHVRLFGLCNFFSKIVSKIIEVRSGG